MTDVSVVPVTEHDKPALWAMLQMYIAELAPWAGVKPVDGVYSYALFDAYWRDEDRHPFWAIADSERVGFALVWQDRENGVARMAEFFVAPRFRRTGLGEAFARDVIERFPGAWKIRQIALNTPAVAFWRKALARYAYTETTFVERNLDRVEQSFVVS